MTRRKFLIQGAVLTAVSLLLRVTNMGYRSFLSQEMGAAGMGLYQLIFSIFMLTVTLSTSGISLGIALALFCLARPAAHLFLGDTAAAPCLRILGVGLPFMSLCTCMKGYFLAVDESLSTAFSDVMEQTLTIGATVLLFWRLAPQSLEAACFAAMLSSTLGEAVSFLCSWAAYRRSLKRNTPRRREKAQGVLQGLCHIALPCTLSSAARSALNTGENLLIPRELQRYGLGYSAALSQYGLLQGMAMPMLYFPSSLLSSFASLLIPKIAKEREQDHRRAVAHITGKAVRLALAFGMFFSGVFLLFGDSWGMAFYHSGDAGAYLRVLAPLAPLVYLDVVVDSLLKGLDEQFNSMKYNFADSFLRVVLVLCLLRFFGMESYVCILFFSTIFNAALSLHRLLKVAQVRLSLLWHVAMPLGCAALAVTAGKAALQGMAFSQPLWEAVAATGVSAALFGGLYGCLCWGEGKWRARQPGKQAAAASSLGK